MTLPALLNGFPFIFPDSARPLVAYLLLLDCIATAAHVTNLPLAIGTVALFAVLTLLTPRRNWQPLALLAGPITLTVAAVLLFNGVIFGT